MAMICSLRHGAVLAASLLVMMPLARAGGLTFIAGSNVTAERLAGLQAAASELGQKIDFKQDIKVSVSFTSLSCTASGAVLGYAGPTTAYSDFAGAPQSGVWYVSAQAANAGVSYALDDASHITAEFNHNLGNSGCLAGYTWYYGADHNPPANQIDFVSTAVHEFMHGLGFLSFIGSDGQLNGGQMDNFSSFLYDNTAGKRWTAMSSAERAASITNNHNLVWDGARNKSMASLLQAGLTASRVQMYAPTTYQSGSSVSHFDVSLLYNSNAHETMEPVAATPATATLAVAAFCDMGWALLQDTDGDGSNDCTDSTPLVADSDGDGVPDSTDAFPANPAEWLDTDHDGTGNNADWDDDGDAVPDAVDSQPLNPAVKSEIRLPLQGSYRGAVVRETNQRQ